MQIAMVSPPAPRSSLLSKLVRGPGVAKSRPGRRYEGHPAAHQVGCQFGQTAEVVLGKTVFDRHVATFDKTDLA